jgi:hypothetical protein
MPTDKKETNTAKGTAKTAKSMSAAVNRSQNPAGRPVFERLPVTRVSSCSPRSVWARITLLDFQLKSSELSRPLRFRRRLRRQYSRALLGISAMDYSSAKAFWYAPAATGSVGLVWGPAAVVAPVAEWTRRHLELGIRSHRRREPSANTRRGALGASMLLFSQTQHILTQSFTRLQ